jgi:hypothetical protein
VAIKEAPYGTHSLVASRTTTGRTRAVMERPCAAYAATTGVRFSKSQRAIAVILASSCC